VRLCRLCAAMACGAAGEVRAHGFGARYDLPLPLSLYLCGAALVVVLSCVMLALVVRARPGRRAGPAIDLLRIAAMRFLAAPPVIAAIRFAAVALYVLLLAAGFFGNHNPFHNIVPIAVWALWWVGLAYFSALVGDLWRIANPLETLFAAAERVHSRVRPGRSLSLGVEVPPWVQAWPAVALYVGFLWMEMVWDGSDVPAAIAAAMLAYSVLTWSGMWTFGREAWLRHGEALTMLFGVLARFSPTSVRLEDRRIVEWKLRPYAAGLLASDPLPASEIVLVVAILAAVSFDGFLETPAWAAVNDALSGGGSSGLLRTAGLLAAPLLFLAVYLLFCRLIAWSGSGEPLAEAPSARRVAGLFVLTLVPIAIAYQVAHYLSFLVTAGQYAIGLVSDPFGSGWNLFGTANHMVRPNIIDARLVWLISVGAIVAGHVAALYLGHLLALREFRDPRAVSRSQWPMLVLMVSYTMLSLWIIAQPIVNSR
jgi:hypothetical protein